MPKKDFYDVLGVAKGSSDSEIKSAYRKLARTHHPDVDKSPGAAEKFKEVSEAYQVLSDPAKRQSYDQYGHSAFSGSASRGGAGAGNPFGEGFNPFGSGGFSYSWGGNATSGKAGDPGFVDPFDLFEQIFGGMGFATEFSQGFRRRQSYQMELTFDEAVSGVTKQVEVQRVEGNNNRVARVRLTIKVPAGVSNGTKMRFGDIDIVFRVRPSSEFVREGYDIFSETKLAIPQVVLGDVIEVKTVHGVVKLKVAPGTQPGSLIRIRGKGVPTLKGGVGDHYVRAIVEVPKTLTSKEKELYGNLMNLKPRKKGWF